VDFGKKMNATDNSHLGSYEFYQANTDEHKYKFISHANMTSMDGSSLYP